MGVSFPTGRNWKAEGRGYDHRADTRIVRGASDGQRSGPLHQRSIAMCWDCRWRSVCRPARWRSSGCRHPTRPCSACGASAPRRSVCACTSRSMSRCRRCSNPLRRCGGRGLRRALRRWRGDRGAGGALLDAGGERVFRRSGWPFTGVHLHAGRIAPAGAGSGIMVGVAEAGMSDEVRVELRDGWRKLVLNRPEKLNAANEAMLTALLHALDAAVADHACRAVLLTGEGRGFCTGQELGPAVMPRPRWAARSWHRRCTASSAGAPIARSAAASGMRGEWRGRGRWGELRAGVRYRSGRPQCEVHPGVCEDRAGAGFRRELLSATADRRGARAGAGHAR